MSINSIGIGAYTKVENPSQRLRPETKPTINPESTEQKITNGEKTPRTNTVSIPQRAKATDSALSVKASSSLAEILSSEEKAALETLFAKYDTIASESASYSSRGNSESSSRLGGKVDFRV